MKAITPNEVLENRERYIHPDIIKVVNEILSQRFIRNSVCKITVKEIWEKFHILNPEFDKKLLFKEKHMDFEDVYRKSGWVVQYDGPAYNETYDAFFKFSLNEL